MPVDEITLGSGPDFNFIARQTGTNLYEIDVQNMVVDNQPCDLNIGLVEGTVADILLRNWKPSGSFSLTGDDVQESDFWTGVLSYAEDVPTGSYTVLYDVTIGGQTATLTIVIVVA